VRQLPDSEYPDVATMSADLRELASDSPAYRLLRDRVVQRCLPVADNIAYRYRGRGDPIMISTRVARLGLLKAQINAAIADLDQRLRRSPTPTELANELGWTGSK
jgi:DNA-directed RNA polymerase specialized sigma subunit